MIITRLLGGLGNQMFQYAAGLALAETRRTVLKLDVSWFREDPAYEAHNRYALSCFNVTEQFATRNEIDRGRGGQLTHAERWSLAIARALRLRRYVNLLSTGGHTHQPDTFRFDLRFFDQPDDTYLCGMWQSEAFFAPVADLLRMHFTFRYPPSVFVAAMAERIRQTPSAAVHFRRGDYVRNATFNREIGVLPLDYYRRAVAKLRERYPDVTLYVFSDDIDAVEREFQPGGKVVFVRATTGVNSHDKIRLMSLCEHAIISNSTFAWWGAWLNPSPTKTVIAPDPWFVSKPNESCDVVPSSWLRFPIAS